MIPRPRAIDLDQVPEHAEVVAIGGTVDGLVVQCCFDGRRVALFPGRCTHDVSRCWIGESEGEDEGGARLGG